MTRITKSISVPEGIDQVSFNELVRPMSKKSKSSLIPSPDGAANSFRLKVGKVEMEARGLGLIVAAIIIVLWVGFLWAGATSVPKLPSLIRQVNQTEPATPQKPPAP